MTADEPGTTGGVRDDTGRQGPTTRKPAWWRRALWWFLSRAIPEDVDKRLGGG